ALASLIVVMNKGRIEDAGPPRRVYARPRSRFTARFMGESTENAGRGGTGGVGAALGEVPRASPAGGGGGGHRDPLPRESPARWRGADLPRRGAGGRCGIPRRPCSRLGPQRNAGPSLPAAPGTKRHLGARDEAQPLLPTGRSDCRA